MPGTPRPVADERDGLLTFLAQQRLVLEIAAFGLTEAQARATPSVSPLSVGGLVKHVALTESYWMDIVEGHRGGGSRDDYEARFRLSDGETLPGVLDRYAAVARRTEGIAARLPLEHPVPVPRNAPWFPKDVEEWSLRWVILHLIQETARHAGHADIVRESIDGATAFPLMAAAEGWPETPWMKPWAPGLAQS
jgi:hypothetical protein